jgi:hypothetical protein
VKKRHSKLVGSIGDSNGDCQTVTITESRSWGFSFHVDEGELILDSVEGMTPQEAAQSIPVIFPAWMLEPEAK